MAGAFVQRSVGATTGRGMAAGDVDGDGWLDVVVTRRGAAGGDGVVCLLQSRTQPGTFTPVASAVGIAIEEDGLQIADLNHDGPLDLVVNPLDPARGSGAVLLGSTVTAGGFATTTLTVTNEGRDRIRVVPTSQTTGRGIPTKGFLTPDMDLDLDGYADVLLQDEGGQTLLAGFTVDTMPPTFSLRTRGGVQPIAQTTGRGLAADFDRDGAGDLCVVEPGVGVRIRWGVRGSPGSFPSESLVVTGGFFAQVATGDLNRDGRPDLVLVDTSAPGVRLYVAHPFTPRTFVPRYLVAVGETMQDLAVGDMNRDGLEDVALAVNNGGAWQVWLLLNDPAFPGNLPGFQALPTGLTGQRSLVLHDLNADGHLDLALCADADPGVSLILTRGPGGGGGFEVASVHSIARGVHIAAGDVNGDGRDDVVCAGPGGAIVTLQHAVERGRFLPALSVHPEAVSDVAVGDLDRDGRGDVCLNVPGTLQVRVLRLGAGPDPVDLALRLNGLPPGTPVIDTRLVLCDTDGDGWSEVTLFHPGGPGLPGQIDVLTTR
jgi:hypothetical protein